MFGSGLSIKRVALFLGAALLFLVFCALGVWQVSRLQWKLDLIHRVESRAYAVPVDPPEEQHWAEVHAENFEYLSVVLRGYLQPQYSTYVQASTRLGAGYWLMIPMKLQSGAMVWLNQGFVTQVPSHTAGVVQTSSTQVLVEVFGLLRMSEANGTVLRQNDPVTNRWYSRNVAALSARHQLTRVAPYFVDAFTSLRAAQGQELVSLRHSDTPSAVDDTGESLLRRVEVLHPVAGLTVLTFRNNHLSYALTWFALATMVAGVSFWLWRRRGEVPL